MVFHCRCFSSLLEQDEQIEYESRSRTKSTATETFYTAGSDFNRSAHNIQTSEISNLAEKPSDLRVFTVAELKEATGNFCIDSKIGDGDFGSVYKGVIKSLEHPFDEIQVAVKLANELLQGYRWRVREINVLGKVEHPNLVKLVGYCAEDNEREDGTQMAFVYEYMANRSVKYHLSAKSETPLSWNTRLKVAQDAARVLTYLHEEMEFQMIFKNFKSSNVLLDDQWNAQLSDFGVPLILGPDGRRVTHISTKISAGSVEYASPEFIFIGHLTSKGDVWCYGIFLYELITGRHPLELITGKHGSDWKQPLNERMLLEWVKPYLGSKKFQQIVDPRLEGNYSLEAAQKLSVLANKCLSENPKLRPKMSEVLEMVNQFITVPASPQAPRAAVDPKKAFEGPTQDENPACSKFLKSCFKKGCCVGVFKKTESEIIRNSESEISEISDSDIG